ncbi:hypothetical protein CsatA_010801 [Cannabis sativa]|uniref:Bifunctional inhibitor/plant lipid transfer protein/seed storage helical domain-containing protein n=1 Tax=Cannabis sativa TaxID=3483 RepID=A0A803PM07_CANSA
MGGSTVFLMFLNLVFFTMVSSSYTTPPPPPNSKAKCPLDTLKLGVCANLLHLVIIGDPSKTPCCTLIGGIANLEAAICLCTAIKANILGINLNVPLTLELLLNKCNKEVPSGFQCPN